MGRFGGVDYGYICVLKLEFSLPEKGNVKSCPYYRGDYL